MSSRRALVLAIAGALLAAAAAGFAPGAGGVACASSSPNAAQVAKALDYVHACQNSDGGFAEKGSASSDPLTAWAIVAIASAGEDPNAWVVNGASPVDFLSHQSAKWQQTTDVARTVLAVVAAQKDPRSFGGVDLVARLHAFTRTSGTDAEQIGPYVNSHIWAMIALKAAGETPSGKDVTWLLAEQNSDGGWGWAPGVVSDSNDTAAALEALAAAGVSAGSSGVARAISYLRTRQTADGGFAYATGSTSDANSTSWVVQALVAAGQKPSSWVVGGHDPVSALGSMQSADGSVRYSASLSSNPLLATVQALPAMRARAYPVAAPVAGAMSTWRPVITPKSPAKGSSVVLSVGSALEFSVSDGSGTGVAPGAVTVRVDGRSISASGSAGGWRAALTGLAAGTHSAAVTATDRAGNQTTLVGWKFTTTSGIAANATTAVPAAALPTSALPVPPAGAHGSASGTASGTVVAASATRTARAAHFAAPADARVGLWVAGIGVLVALGAATAIAAVRRRRG